VQHLLAAAGVEARHLLQRRQRHPVGRRVAEPHAVELHRQRAVGQRHRARRLATQRLQVEHLEDALEADQRRHHVEPGSGQRRQRRVQPGDQQRQRHHLPGGQRAAQGQPATQAVDQGERERGDQREGRDERPLHHRRAHTDVAHARRPRHELGGLLRGPPEQLHQGGARCGEPLGHLRGHPGVVLGGLALQRRQPPADPPGG
jgi:hypothetical protein